MELRNVGQSGLKVSAVGLGCNNFGWGLDKAASTKIIHRALDLGVTLFDTAPVYGDNGGESEQILGKALGARREQAVIVSKFGMAMDRSGRTNTSRSQILRDIEGSLQRLNTDYIDLYMIHWPDWSTPIEETLGTLDDLIRAGKVRYAGCCNIPAWRLVEADWTARNSQLNRFIVSQNEYSLAERSLDRDLIPAMEQYKIGLMPYAPLANGLLTGKFSRDGGKPEDSRLAQNKWGTGDRYLAEKKLKLADELGEFAKRNGHSLLDLAIGWQLSNPLICSVIAGATKVGQLEANVAAANNWRLTTGQMMEVDKICKANR